MLGKILFTSSVKNSDHIISSKKVLLSLKLGSSFDYKRTHLNKDLQ